MKGFREWISWCVLLLVSCGLMACNSSDTALPELEALAQKLCACNEDFKKDELAKSACVESARKDVGEWMTKHQGKAGDDPARAKKLMQKMEKCDPMITQTFMNALTPDDPALLDVQ